MTGPPEVFPEHGDKAGAWASQRRSGGIEWLEVGFPAASLVEAIYVFETLRPGAVYALEALAAPDEGAAAGAPGELLWKGHPADFGKQAALLVIRLDSPRPVAALRLWLDTSIVSSWNEIDAVALRGSEPAYAGTVDWRPKPAGAKSKARPRPIDAPSPEGGAEVGTARRCTTWEMKEKAWSTDPRLVWAAQAEASSYFGSGHGWGAPRATGPPDVFPNHGDKIGAWAPRQRGGGIEHLDLTFPADAPTATAIYVFETYNPGAVYAAELPPGRVTYRDTGERRRRIWKGRPAQPSESGALVLVIGLDPPLAIRRVRLWLDTSISYGWNEIDCVALVASEPVHEGPVNWLPKKSAARACVWVVVAVVAALVAFGIWQAGC